MGLADQVRLTATSIDVSMSAEEGIPNTGLVPPGQKILIRVVEEATNIGSSEWESGNAVVQDHRDGDRQVIPV